MNPAAANVTVEAQVMDQLCVLRDDICCAILLITHSLGLVARYCETVTAMYAGEVIEDGRSAVFWAAMATAIRRVC